MAPYAERDAAPAVATTAPKRRQKDERARSDQKRRRRKREEVRLPRHARPRIVDGGDVREARVDAHRGQAHGNRALALRRPSLRPGIETRPSGNSYSPDCPAGTHAPTEAAKRTNVEPTWACSSVEAMRSNRPSHDLPGREVASDAGTSQEAHALRVEHDVDGRGTVSPNSTGRGAMVASASISGGVSPRGCSVGSSSRASVASTTDPPNKHHEGRQAEGRKVDVVPIGSGPDHAPGPRRLGITSEERGAGSRERSFEETTTGSMSSNRQGLENHLQTLLVAEPFVHGLLPASRTAVNRPVRASRNGNDDPADVRKALLPGRVLNHHREGSDDARPPRARVGSTGPGRKSEMTKTKEPGVTARGCQVSSIDLSQPNPAGLRIQTTTDACRESRSACAPPSVCHQSGRRPRSRDRRRSRRPPAFASTSSTIVLIAAGLSSQGSAARSTPSRAVGRRRSRP